MKNITWQIGNSIAWFGDGGGEDVGWVTDKSNWHQPTRSHQTGGGGGGCGEQLGVVVANKKNITWLCQYHIVAVVVFLPLPLLPIAIPIYNNLVA